MRADLRFTALGTPWNIIFDADFAESSIFALERRIRMRLEDFERVYSRFRPDSLVSHIKIGDYASAYDQYAATGISAIGQDKDAQKSAGRESHGPMTGDTNGNANRHGDDSIGSHGSNVDGGKRGYAFNGSDHADDGGIGNDYRNHGDAHRDDGGHNGALVDEAGAFGGAHRSHGNRNDTRGDRDGQKDDAIHTMPSHHGLWQEEGRRPATAHETHARNANAQSVIFPEDAEGLFALADAMYVASGGHIDPCVGADLEALGYDDELRFTIVGSHTDGTGHSPDNGTRPQPLSNEGSASRRSSSQTANGTSHRTSPPSASADLSPVPSAAQSAPSAPTAPTLASSQASAISSSQSMAPTTDSRRPVPRNHPRNQSRGIASPDSSALRISRTWDSLGAAHRPTWAQLRAGAGPCELRIPAGSPPPALDFGAYGKGYAVDLVADLLEAAGVRSYVIDASGDLRVRSFGSLPLAQDGIHKRDAPTQADTKRDAPASTNLPRQPREPLRVALESPFDASQAVGVAEIRDGSFCASGVTRRHWHDDASGMELHHILDAISGRPAHGILASWTYVGPTSNMRPSAPSGQATSSDAVLSSTALTDRYPTAVADAVATALFSSDPVRLRDYLPYDFALVRADGIARGSAGFPGRLFTQ